LKIEYLKGNFKQRHSIHDFSGLTHLTAVPIQDGFCLQSGIIRTPLGGNYVNDQSKKHFQEKGVNLVDLSRRTSGKNIKLIKRSPLLSLTSFFEIRSKIIVPLIYLI